MRTALLRCVCCACCLHAAVPVQAGADVAPPADARISYVSYSVDAVTVIAVQPGIATRIVLASDEHILRDGASTGYAADCGKPELEWCMRADPGSSQVLVRPKPGATSNNLELRTDKRDYSFRFEVLRDPARPGRAAATKAAPQYRVIFRYPEAQPASATPAAPTTAQLIRDARPEPRNWHYAMQVLPGAADIAPALVFDDGRFTYLQFPANREMPTVFYLGASGEEARANFHIAAHDPGLLVVERIARRLVLRLGKAVVGLWNEAYDADGVAPVAGTTVDGLARSVRGSEQ